MVVDQLTDAEIDQLFRALADSTRRDIIVRAAGGELSVSGLARAYPISITAVQKHVETLESAGLVRKERRGREQVVTTEPATLIAAGRALDRLEVLWRERLERLGALMDSTEPEGHT